MDIQIAALSGFAVLRDGQGITLNRTWSHKELANALGDLLPQPFACTEGDPGWYLATMSKRHLRIVPLNYPTGADADYNKGAGTTGWRNNRLWIGQVPRAFTLSILIFSLPVTRKPIPDEIIQTWASPEVLAFRGPAG